MKNSYEECLQEAKEMFAYGHDTKYIEFQLAEKKVSDEMIDRIIVEVKNLRKEVKRHAGIKQLFIGVSISAVAILFTFLSFNSDSPVGYVLWGMAITGLCVALKGVANIMNL